VVPSASASATIVAGLALLSGAALAGCATTQQQSARSQLRAERELASRRSVRVTRSNPVVTVLSATRILAGAGTAIVVSLRNSSAAPISDLPLSVGVVMRGGGRLYLNRGTGLDYFQTHIPAVPAHGTLTWVFTSHVTAPASSGAFALVGLDRLSAVTGTRTLPAIRTVAVAARGPAGPGLVAARVTNESDIPQYSVPVYAVSTAHGRYVAAGRGLLPELDAGASATVLVRLLGSARRAVLSLQSPATIAR
jgi:hypothetical protein